MNHKTTNAETGTFSFQTGYVLFVDLLGFVALTSSGLILDKQVVQPHGLDSSIEDRDRHVVLAYALQWRFRHTLDWCKKHHNVKVFQFSDSAYIFARSAPDVLRAAAYILRTMTCEGCLVRAGLAHGRVLESEDEYSNLGSIVLGNAVTSAYLLCERKGKGKAQLIVVPEDLVLNLTAEAPQLAGLTFRPISPECSSINWTHLPNTFVISAELGPNAHLYEPLAHLLFSDQYDWNCETEEGREKVCAAILSVAASISSHSDYRFLALTESQGRQVVALRPLGARKAVEYKLKFFRHANDGKLWLPTSKS